MGESFEKFIPRTRRAFSFGVLIALGVLAMTIFSGLLFVRSLVREQIIRRDAEALYATTLMEQLDLAPEAGDDVRTDEQIGFDSALRASRLRGVMGIRFFDHQGDFSDTFPGTILPQPLDGEAYDAVRTLKPHGRFDSSVPLSDVFIYLPQFASGNIKQVPVLMVTVPLHQRDARKLAGVAQFIIEGQTVADEYMRLDHRLIQIATITFLAAGTLLVAMLWPAFRRVEKLNRALAQRSERLQRANEELALAARVSAVGAVSAHLMHGLKNPLASLSQFMSRGDEGMSEADREDWEDALTASRRMQSLVEHTLEVLSDVQGEPVYELTVAELGDDIQKRIETTARRKSVRVDFTAEGNCALSSRTANLAGLVLVNLLENAIQVSPEGGRVLLAASRNEDCIMFRVQDEGGGYPEDKLDHLFLPGKSTREGGSGIGLAISKQVADYLGAKLELEKTSASGCVFLLELPMSACQEELHD